MAGKIDLLVVGAGAKATALAAKVHSLNTLGAGPLSLTIVEATELAASWLGRNGMTSGEEPLAIPPIKDIGFPYQSSKTFGELGAELDRAMMPFTWQQYMVGKGQYARWVNAGSPAVQHRDYGRYLTWVLTQATEGVTIVRGRVTQVSLPGHGDHWMVEVMEPSAHPDADGRRPLAAAGSTMSGAQAAEAPSRWTPASTSARRWCLPARVSTALSPTTPTPRRGSFTATADAASWRASPSSTAQTSRSSAAARARSAP